MQKEFETAVRQQITTILRTTRYRPSYYMRMVNEIGAYQAAIDLVRSPHPSDGFRTLAGIGRLDLSVEALVLEPRFNALFSDED